MNLSHALYLAADVREMERRCIETYGIPADILMLRAGAELFALLRERYPAAGRVLVLCGSGNNGGDGYAAARLGREAGLAVSVCAIGDPAHLKDAAANAHRQWIDAGGAVEAFSSGVLDRVDVVIDALLGTGANRIVEGELAVAINAVNATDIPVIAVDIPSGLHADTGTVLGVAMRADWTVSFVGMKAGLFTGHGPACAGQRRFADLGVPVEVYGDQIPVAMRLHEEQLAGWLPARERDAHKGDFGFVLVVGGGQGMPGAARLCGEAALRGGAGRVSAAVWPDNVSAIAGSRPEIMCRGIDEPDELEPQLEKVTVLAVGPGLGGDAWAESVWRFLCKLGIKQPRVLDADALNWMSERPMSLTAEDIITPHPGEAARLLQCTVRDIEADRFATARELAMKFGCVAVLKGAGTLIASPSGALAVCDFGNPGMASAGMGDVLTGLIAALRAQHVAAFDAACGGVLIHALAGDRAARQGERGVLASDVIEALRHRMNPGHRRGVEK